MLWKSMDLGIDHSSPIIIGAEGEEQLIMLTPEALFAVDPSSGALLWEEGFKRADGCMVSPVWTTGESLFVSTPRGGSYAFGLSERDGKPVPEQLWHTSKMRMAFMNPVQVGDYVVGASGTGPGFLVCLDLRTGKRAWVDRSVGLATLVHGDGKLIILSETGELALGTMTPEGLTIHSRCKITDPESFAVPTLVGTTLYVRDRHDIMALDLS
jgi:outer membrane protein assembly factor BamB